MCTGISESDLDMQTAEKFPQYFAVPIIYLRMEGEKAWKSMPRPKTARQLLAALDLDEEEALVARDGNLLTPDRRIWPGDKIWVRPVGSRG